jgi:hypothetical protein
VVAEAHAIDVGLLDVDAHPEVVGVDDGDERLAAVHRFAGSRRADVDDAVDGRVDLGVGEPHVGLRSLRGGRLLHVLGRLQLAGLHHDLLRVGLRQGERGLLRLDLSRKRIGMRARDFVRHARLVHLLGGRYPLVGELARALELELRVLERGAGFSALRFGRGQRGGRLRDRVGRLVFLVVQRGFRLAHLRAGAGLARREVLAVGRELARVDDGDHLIARHPIAFHHHQLRQPAIDLRADDDVVGGDDAGQDEGGRSPEADVRHRNAGGGHKEEDENTAAHG